MCELFQSSAVSLLTLTLSYSSENALTLEEMTEQVLETERLFINCLAAGAPCGLDNALDDQHVRHFG